MERGAVHRPPACPANCQATLRYDKHRRRDADRSRPHALTGLERGFGIPKEKILVVPLPSGRTQLCSISTMKPGKNISLVWDTESMLPQRWATGETEHLLHFHHVTRRPLRLRRPDNNPQAIESDYRSGHPAPRRSAAVLSHGYRGAAHYAVKRLKLQATPESVAQDLLAHLLPGVIVVSSMVSAIPLLEKKGTSLTCAFNGFRPVASAPSMPPERPMLPVSTVPSPQNGERHRHPAALPLHRQPMS